MTMEGKTVLITGGNSGIGKETAVGLARVGASVVFTSRDAAKGAATASDVSERAGRVVVWMQLDLASFASIRRFAADFRGRYERLDVLVNNAGLIMQHRTETQDGFETTFGVNHIGHFLLTQLLLDRVKSSAPARIVNVASDAHRQARSGLDFDDLQSTKRYGGLAAYGKSKLANILFTRELARRLEGTGVTANAVHPGTVATGFGQDGDITGIFALGFGLVLPFFKKPAKGAETSIYVASAPELEGVTGKYFADGKEKQPTAVAQDDAAARKLWEISEALAAGVQSPAGR
jgi:NAD(P)-dependent dehydrogenase (short-subunit alcohol dehydrogenase family)